MFVFIVKIVNFIIKRKYHNQLVDVLLLNKTFNQICPFFILMDFHVRINTLKIRSMIRKYHNHKLLTNPSHHEEELHNNHETLERQTKQSSQLSLPHQDDCNPRMDIK